MLRSWPDPATLDDCLDAGLSRLGESIRVCHEEAVAREPARRGPLLADSLDGDRERATLSDSSSTAWEAARDIDQSARLTVLAEKATVGRPSSEYELPSWWERSTILGKEATE